MEDEQKKMSKDFYLEQSHAKQFELGLPDQVLSKYDNNFFVKLFKILEEYKL